MKQRGRKSAAELASPTAPDRKPPRLDPPSFLTNAAKALFSAIVASVDRKHFVKSDVPLLATFVQTTLVARQGTDNFAQFERAARLQASLAVRLRLTPSARISPKTVGRHTPPSDTRWPWESQEEFETRTAIGDDDE